MCLNSESLSDVSLSGHFVVLSRVCCLLLKYDMFWNIPYVSPQMSGWCQERTEKKPRHGQIKAGRERKKRERKEKQRHSRQSNKQQTTERPWRTPKDITGDELVLPFRRSNAVTRTAGRPLSAAKSTLLLLIWWHRKRSAVKLYNYIDIGGVLLWLCSMSMPSINLNIEAKWLCWCYQTTETMTVISNYHVVMGPLQMPERI